MNLKLNKCESKFNLCFGIRYKCEFRKSYYYYEIEDSMFKAPIPEASQIKQQCGKVSSEMRDCFLMKLLTLSYFNELLQIFLVNFN